MKSVDNQSFLRFLDRANQISSLTDLGQLLDQTLAFAFDIFGAQFGTLYLRTLPSNQQDEFELILKAIKEQGSDSGTYNQDVINQKVVLYTGPIMEALSQHKITETEIQQPFPLSTYVPLGELPVCPGTNMLILPLAVNDEILGSIHLYAYEPGIAETLSPFIQRLATEIDKLIRINAYQHYNERLKELIEYIGRIGSSLDRDQILKTIIADATELLGAEASSLFLVDEATGDSVLKIASNMDVLSIEEVRIPPGKGIIGATIQTGISTLVDDSTQDKRHYNRVDKESGFNTRSLVAVPLKTRPIALGEELGSTEERIIGALESLNKKEGAFDQNDIELLKTLANQTATVLQIAEIYSDANSLFMDIIKALAAAIDAKDPYTVGHSHRVSTFAIAVARQLGLSPDVIQHIRIGGLLHDIGKIGVPDAILLKPGKLTQEEYSWMKKHPEVGENIMSQVRMLHNALPCLGEHHEKVDGTGYPRGLKGDQISLLGRIIAVADVFDAITSDRPYRAGVSVEDGITILREGIGTQFDEICAKAIIELIQNGKIIPHLNCA